MTKAKISEQELASIFEAAKGAGNPPGGGVVPHALGPVGACTAVSYGNPDQCRQLREAECEFVSRELEARNAGFAKWRPGNCDI